MRLTVFGATGGTGKEIVRQALDAGHQVTAVVRDPARLTVSGDGLEVVTVAAVTDPASLRPLVAGRDAVLSGIGPTSPRRTGIAEASARAVVRAMEETGTRRVVTISAAPVGAPAADESALNKRVLYPLIGRLLKPVYTDLAAMEAELRASALDWTAVRPGNLGDKPFTGHYRRAVGANVPRAGTLGRADLALAMLECVADEGTYKQVVGLGAGG
ncbi:NAD(P)H-binding protein [Streptomyces sp. NPDC051940]|uniref:NAD(P)-dependent oxidoreductase n=1 Tax=Streptomyces sp. NPDC051940 TaxID=3155675 RepID=UPI00341D297F